MRAAEKLAQRLGASIQESVGVRSGPAGNVPPPTALLAQDQGRGRLRGAGTLLLANIVPDPNQPRQTFLPEELERLAASLKAHGQKQPVRVRWVEALQKWMLLCGEMRYRAAQLAGLETLDCLFLDRPLTELEVLTEQLIENEHRVNPPAIEQARGFRRWLALAGCNQRQLAATLFISEGHVSKLLGLLAQPQPVQELVASGQLPASTAAELSSLPAVEQVELGQEAAKKKLPRSQVKARVAAKKTVGTSKPEPSVTTYHAGEALVSVRFPRPAEPGEIIHALETALASAMTGLPRLAA